MFVFNVEQLLRPIFSSNALMRFHFTRGIYLTRRYTSTHNCTTFLLCLVYTHKKAINNLVSTLFPLNYKEYNTSQNLLQINSNRARIFTELYFSPFLLWRGTARIPFLSSETGMQAWPPKSSFSDMSYSWTSIRRRANSGTVNGNSNVSFQFGIQLSSSVFVFFIPVSAGTPAIPTYRMTCINKLELCSCFQ